MQIAKAMTDVKSNKINVSAMPVVHKKTAAGLVAYCEAQLGKPYWYGTFGQVSTTNLLDSKMNQYPKYYTASNFVDQLGVKVHDCIGLIKGYMWSKSVDDEHPAYASNGFKDWSADGYYRHAKEKGAMSSFPNVVGVAVFMKGHVGVYVGNGEVIEARGHAYGVVKTKLNRRNWTSWAFIDEIYYEQR